MYRTFMSGLLLMILTLSAQAQINFSYNHLLFAHPEMVLAQNDSTGIPANAPIVDDSATMNTPSEILPAVTEEVIQPLENRGMTTPKKRFFQSALIPGWGQFSNHDYLFTAAFVGIEAATIFLYMDYNQQGNDKEDEFKAFADLHYRPDVYENWVRNYKPLWAYVNRLDEDSLPPQFTHDWDEEGFKSQQYYEMIGKYRQFYVGWDDGKPCIIDSAKFIGYLTGGEVYNLEDSIRMDININEYWSENAQTYMKMRDESNAMFKKAGYMLAAVALNHIGSAIQAAWKATRMDKQVEKATGLKESGFQFAFQPDLTSYRMNPTLMFTAKF